VKLGFGFSAGLFDYVLNYGLSTRPLLLLPVGAAYFAIYYFTFSWCIRRFDLKTPGRETDVAPVAEAGATPTARGPAFVAALGGPDNLRSVDACTTRLRLVLERQDAISEPTLKGLGARGVLKLQNGGLQVVLGPIADQVAGEIRAAIAAGPAPAPVPGGAAGAIAAALGVDNLRSVQARATRLLVEVVDATRVDLPALGAAGVRATAAAGTNKLHLIVGAGAPQLAAELSGG